MTDRDEFLTWVGSALHQAELALHNGDSTPRRALWSRNEPVSVLGAFRNAHGQHEIDELFTALGNTFSDCKSYDYEVQAYDVVGDMAYTAGLEHTSASIDGQPGCDRGTSTPRRTCTSSSYRQTPTLRCHRSA